MTLNNEVAQWINNRPNWQKRAFRLFCAGKAPEDLNYKALADQLLAEDGISSKEINPEQIPGSFDSAEKVTLSAVSNLKGINALIPDQTLDFAPEGLTIVFGNNGCGKSGYARLLKETVTARADPDEILGNAFIKEQTEQAATFRFQVNGTEGSRALFSTDETPLSRIRFYDETCGDLYVKKASTTSYQPSVLTLLDKLTTACELLSAELSKRIEENDQSKPDLPKTHEGTSATKFLNSLTHNTSAEAIDAHTALPDGYEKKTADLLAESARLNGTSPLKEKERLTKLSEHWALIAKHAKTMTDSLNDSAITLLADLTRKTKSLRDAARIASLKNFEDQPLTGVGSETWRVLWEAARQYSLNEAYENQKYPVTGPGSLCLLCQQPLADEAVNRLQSFESFITNSAERDAEEHETIIRQRRDDLSKLQSLPKEVTQALRKIGTQETLVDGAIAWFDLATRLAKDTVNWLDGTNQLKPDPLDSEAHVRFSQTVRQLTESADKINVESFDQTLEAVSKQLHELQDMKALFESKDDLAAEVLRLVDRQRLVEARKQTPTNAITKKRSEIVENHVTQDVSAHFLSEVETFGLQNVALSRSGRGKSTALDHQPELVGSATKIKLEQVLSEGEQTVLGLAGFLTEVEFDGSNSGVCFDDPVTSLDAERRSKVAERLVTLAESRQVIVFTHEITFVHALVESARWRQVGVLQRTIQRGQDRAPGLIMQGFPWQVQNVGERINALYAELGGIKRNRSMMSDSEYTTQIEGVAGKLSTTLERSVFQNIVNQLMDRGSNQVRPLMLRILPKFTNEDLNEFDRIYSSVSSWAVRHDNAAEENYTPPDIATVQAAIAAFQIWDRRMKSYSN